MSIDIADGFNFAIGQWLGELAIFLIGGAVILVICGIVYGGLWLYDKIKEFLEEKE